MSDASATVFYSLEQSQEFKNRVENIINIDSKYQLQKKENDVMNCSMRFVLVQTDDCNKDSMHLYDPPA